jgi:TolC family type I secretion outer membrane protein
MMEEYRPLQMIVASCLLWMLAVDDCSAQSERLTVQQAVTLALENHPSLRVAEAGVRTSSAVLTQAQASYYPSLNITGSASRTDGAFVFNPSFPPRNQTYNNYSTALAIQQTLYDFGRTHGRVSANDQLVEASTMDYEATRNAVIANVQIAYFAVVQARRLLRVAEETIAQTGKHLTQAKAFYNVGTRSLFDVTKAEVDVAEANVNLIQARNQLRVSMVQLENAMGVHPKGGVDVTDTLSVAPFTMTLDSVKAIAFRERPEMRASRARLNANNALVSAAWSQNLPSLSAFGNWTWSAFNLPLYSRWNAGVTLSLPVFQGFSVAGQVEQAKANEDASRAAVDLLTESMVLEIEQAYWGIKEAEERIAATTKLVEQAEQNLNLAERQYIAGVGTAIETTDAQLALSNARVKSIQALFDYNSSLVSLWRAMGVSGR